MPTEAAKIRSQSVEEERDGFIEEDCMVDWALMYKNKVLVIARVVCSKVCVQVRGRIHREPWLQKSIFYLN